MTPQRHVRDWLHNHKTSAIELSFMVGKSSSYVSRFLCPSGGNATAIKLLDPVVHFPPKIVEDADEEITAKQKKRDVTDELLRHHNDLIMAWKAPKEVV